MCDSGVATEQHRPSPEDLGYAFRRVREITGIRRPLRPQRLPMYYTSAEVYAGAGRVSPKHRLHVDWLMQSGLRISEFHKLDLRDLDPIGHQARVNQGKGGKDRIVP